MRNLLGYPQRKPVPKPTTAVVVAGAPMTNTSTAKPIGPEKAADNVYAQPMAEQESQPISDGEKTATTVATPPDSADQAIHFKECYVIFFPVSLFSIFLIENYCYLARFG